MKLKKLFVTGLLLAVAFAACTQKEEPFEQPEEVNPSVEPVEGEFSYIFKVASDQTKTTFAENHVAWEDGDKVASYASTSQNQPAAVAVSGGGDVTINVKSTVALTAGDVVYAYYPYSEINNEAASTAVTLDIPANQVSGSADAMPMVALPFTLTGNVEANTETEVGTLQFLNLGSVIKLNIYSSNASFQGETIESVEFQAGAACAGSFTYNLTTVNASSPAAISGYSATSVVVSGRATVGTDASHAGEYSMVVAPGSYSGSFIIRTNRADYTYVSGKSRDYERAHVKPLNIDLGSANWVANTSYDTSIDSPREFLAFLAGTSSGDTADYTITSDLNMDGYSLISSASGFGGTLDGGDHTISNLTASVPLFAQISGSVSNLTLDGTCAFTPAQTLTEFGALAASDNGGTYENVSTAASITITALSNITNNIALGGLIGASNNDFGSTFNSCSNSGAITINAAGRTHWAVAMGGIVGWTKKSTFDTCTNSGALSLTALYGDPFHNWSYVSGATTDPDGNICMGGIVGKTWEINTDYSSSFNKCVNLIAGTITLNHTRIDQLADSDADYGCLNVGGVCGQGNGSLESCQNYAPISATAIATGTNDWWTRQNCILHVGGIVGKSNRGMQINSCSNKEDATITVNYDGNWPSSMSDWISNGQYMSSVGGIIGGEARNSSTAKISFSSNRGPITVTGLGTINVGGICGAQGFMRGNRVYDTAVIDMRCRRGCVGGLLGFANGSAQYQHIRTSYCEADINAESSYAKSSSDVITVGGLIGQSSTGNSGDYPSLVPWESDSYRCHYSGNIVSTKHDRVGMVIGTVTEVKTKVFGASETPVQVTGTIYKKDMAEPAAIDASNVETFAIGYIKEGTVTIYVECSGAPAPAPSLKLMSFNIKGSDSFKDRRGGIVSMINGESPDIIGLQEVDDLSGMDLYTEAGGTQPWNYLKDNLTAYTGYRPSAKTNAILYKTATVELTNTGIFYLGEDYNTSGSGNSWDSYERTALYGTLREKSSGQNYFFITTHYPLNQTGQTNSCSLIESRIAALNTNDYPVILMGDFNCVIGNTCWDGIKTWMKNTRYYADTIVSTENRDLYTYNAFGDSSKDRNKVDHIWVSKSRINVDSYVTLTQEIRRYGSEAYLSDHYPIIAHIS